jgi:hypothetical protein
MEENGTEGSQRASNVVSFCTEQLLDGDKADGSSCWMEIRLMEVAVGWR